LFSPWTTPEQLGESVQTLREQGLGELFHEIGRNRLRLYEELPIYYAAARDGALTDTWEDGDEGAGRRKGYNVEHPWRFLDRRTRVAWALSGLLRERLSTTTELAQLAAAVELATRVDASVDVEALVHAIERGLARLRETMRALAAERSGGPPRGRSVRAEPVYLRGRCNNGCAACPNREQWAADDEPALVERIERARASGRPLVLAGREPTIHPAFLRLVMAAQGHDKRAVGVVSNGRMFALPGLAQRARRVGLESASVKIFAPEPALADAIARVEGGFAQALAGFAALAAARVPGRELRAPLHADNLEHFDAYAPLARRLGATQLRVEAALDAVRLDRLDAAAAALARLAARCEALALPLEVSPLDSGTGRIEWLVAAHSPR
jgi:pyruvate-formate lyase-activating enzyme